GRGRSPPALCPEGPRRPAPVSAADPGRGCIRLVVVRVHCPPMHSVGVGLVGAGPWGLTLARAFERVPGARLRWICERDADRRRLAATAHPDARVVADLDAALTDGEVAAVAVAVDSQRHHAVAMRVLGADR